MSSFPVDCPRKRLLSSSQARHAAHHRRMWVLLLGVQHALLVGGVVCWCRRWDYNTVPADRGHVGGDASCPVGCDTCCHVSGCANHHVGGGALTTRQICLQYKSVKGMEVRHFMVVCIKECMWCTEKSAVAWATSGFPFGNLCLR